MNQVNESENSIDIVSINDEDIKRRIIDLNAKQLTLVRNMSYYYLAGHIAEIINHVRIENVLEDTDIKNEKQLINSIINTIVDSFEEYHLAFTEEEILDKKARLISSRKELYNLANALKGYVIELSYIKEILDHYSMRNLGKDRGYYEVSNKDIDYLIDRIDYVLSNRAVDYNTYIKIISNILLVTPFRMSKFKYYDVLRKTLLRNYRNYSVNIVENKVEEYKMVFDSTLLGDYGILFDQYFAGIQKLKRRKLDNIKPDELDDINTVIKGLNDKINNMNMLITELGIIINKLLVLYLTKGITENLTDEDDIYLKLKYFEKKHNRELLNYILETSKKRFKENENKLLEQTSYFEKLVHESTNRGIIYEDVLDEGIRKTGEVLAYYNDVKFIKQEMLYLEKNEIINDTYLEQLIDSLIQYINRSISTMSNLERKIRMRRLLSLIELPFENKDEFLMYMKYSFDKRVVAVDEIAFALFALNQILDEFIERQ